jgi:hypothetical protein
MSKRSAAKLLCRLPALTVALGLAASCDDCGPDLFVIPQPDDVIDVFEQNQAANVDILWVIDNSESMEVEQAKIAGRFAAFFRQLIVSQVNYHIGVITTDAADGGRLRTYNGPPVAGCESGECRFLTSQVPCPNPDVATAGLAGAALEDRLLDECPAQAVFKRLIEAGIGGSPFEQGFLVAAQALGASQVDPGTGLSVGEVPAENVGFLRGGASLYVVFVSDEDEGAKIDGDPVGYYQRLFQGLKGAGNENLVSISTIAGWPKQPEVPALDEVCGILQSTLDRVPSTDHPEAALVQEIMRTPGGCIDESAGPGEQNAFAETGGRFIELACRTNGVVANICEQDYALALDRLGANAAGLLRRFPLSDGENIEAGPDCELFTSDDPILDCDKNDRFDDEIDGPLCVSARPIDSAAGDEKLISRDLVSGWTWDDANKVVRFDGNFVPAPGSQVTIRYKLQLGASSCR